MKSGTTSKMNSRSDETMLVDQGVSSNGSRLAESATVTDATADMMDMSRADDGANVSDTNDSGHASGSGVRRNLKLRDHKVRVTGVEKRYKILLAYKKAECKRFVRDHLRRVHELYCLENMGGTILDAVDLLNLKEENKPRELLMLLEKYRLTDQVEPVAGPVDLESLQKPDVVEDSTSCPRIPTPETQIPTNLKPSPTKTATTPTTTATTPTKIATSTKKVTAPTEPTPRSATTVPLAATPAVIITQSATVTTPRPSVTSVPLRATSQPPATSTPSPTASRTLAIPTPPPVTLRIPTTTPTSSISAQPVIATKSAPAPPPKIVTVPTVTTPTPPRATTPVVTSATPPRATTPAATVLTPPRAATPTATMVTPPRATTPAATVLTPPRATTPAAAGSAATMSTAATSTATTNQNQSQDKSEPHSKSPEKSSSPRGPKKFSEKLKAEAAVVQRVAELQREGMWYDKRLPKAHDQPRLKSHWDYLLEEMQWLAVDFAVEKKWKRLAARKCARMVEKYFADKKLAEEKAKKDEKVKVQKIAAFMAKEIRNFWSNVRKLVEYKEQSKIEELRKKTMDQHLSFIVDQTEKISSMLAESFSTDVKPYCLPAESDAADSTLSSLKVFDDGLTNSLSDDEFLPSPESEDDEETIALAETEAKDVRREVDLLKKESEMPIDDILDNLPPSYVDIIIREGEFDEEMPRHLLVYDATGEADEYEPSGSESDLEDTILEEERMAATGASKDSATELKELEEDNLLSVEQLRAKYMKPQDSDNESTDVDNNTENDTEVNDSEDEESVFGDADETTSAEDQEHQSSLATLLQTFAPERAGEDHGDDELNSVAALAESFQPTGYTLSSTSVATKIPPLLKHILREYQHIGLDWLVTMYDKKLNGILADEMGLGKTIQTIALLAHLACEKGNWGPHLIIVPTSVMLNWEMEFLKWCPGFKVLTYYGSIKERKAKRTGWTKPNTFHVCITSYKILIQDHHAFRRKRWKYLILDEAQNIKNFKSQRWQLLLNFSTHRRLLLTGTPLQNNLMELWSLMHFLMPNVFQSHREFRQWFSNPMTGMIEGNSEYNENIIKRLHKVLRPFILRRLKSEVEKQLPQKYEHIVLCRLSKRQRYLYEDFMSRAKTKETLQSGSLLSVINVLMQLRKVCNHPNLFEPRPIISPLQTKGFPYLIPSLVYNMRDEEQENTVTYNIWNLTSNEECLDKQMAKKLRSLVSKNYRLTIRYVHGNPIMETIHFPTPKLESLRSIIDLSHSRPEDDIIIPIDGDEDCSIIFEHKSDPTLVRKKMYTFQKSVVPNPPRLKNPFPLFTVDTTPTDFLLEDKEFLAGLKQELSQQSLSLRPPSSSTLVRRDDWIEATLPSNAGRRSQRQPRVTKLSNSEYPMKLATTANGSDVILTTNGVCVVKPEPSQTTVATTVPYASFKTKRKRPTEVDVEERRSPLDAVVVDFEDSAAVEYGNAEVTSTVKASEKFEILSLAKSNGIDDEQGIDVLGGNGEDGEFGESPSKIPRLETPVRGRKRQSSESPLPRKGSRYTEEDDEESSPTKRRRATKAKPPKRRRIDLYNIELEEVVYRRLMDRQAVISNIKTINNRRLQVHTVYGADLLHQVQVVGVLGQLRYYKKPKRGTHWKVVYARPEVRDHESHGYFNLGYHEVMLAKRMKTSLDEFERNHPYHLWRMTQGLLDLTWTLSDATEFLEGILKRFIIYTPAVSAPRIQMRVFRPSVSPYAEIQSVEQELSTQLKRPLEPLRPMFSAMETQFPDPRLIQYDCGKLQVLDGLLRRLKAESHRVLIFTQMAKMLDVLEAFLNHHGYIYLRLDGATKIEQRQLLMEKFNTNKRIFCFILSTRSGGIGVNLTGADTVIFYDSDWNPTMDAQAQDRCHRIGQTRDVHIYRLVSEKTVEENILKKSNQKKLLGELAIEGGNFTTAYFKKNTIHDIFDVDEREGDAKKRMAEILETPVPSPVPTPGPSTQFTIKEEEDSSKRSATYILESALAAAEDDSDVLAARTVKAEAAAELAEFDEDIPLLDEEATEIEEPSHVDQEMEYIMSELSSVERYALAFMETTIDDWSKETFANAQREIEIQKLEWEQEQQQQLDNRANEQLFGDPVPLLTVEEQLEDMLTYPMLPQDFWFDEVLGYKVPMYGPPTPPLGDDDVYIDHAAAMLYDLSTTMPEHLLPKVWQGPKPSKAVVVDSPAVKSPVEETPTPESTTSPKKATSNSAISGLLAKTVRRDEPIFAPRSLFDRPSPALAKLRRDFKIQKLTKTQSKLTGGLSISTQPLPKSVGPPGAISFPVTGPKASQVPTDILEWTPIEDNVLLQSLLFFSKSMTGLMEVPPNLLVVNLAQTPNWDFSTEDVNTISRINRSQKQCKARYDQVIQPREEGKYVEPIAQKKKKGKAFIKLSPPPAQKGRCLKTAEILALDNFRQLKTMFDKKFTAMKSISKERKDVTPPITSPSSNNPRTPKQHAVFGEHNINFDAPLPLPVIANKRLERLLAERAKQIATQRAQHAELIAAAAAARNTSSIIRLPQQQPQGQLVAQSAGATGLEQLGQTHVGTLVLGVSNSCASTTSMVSTVQATPTLIETLSQIPGFVLPPRTGQTSPQRAPLAPASRSPIQIHQTPSIQSQSIATHQAAGQTLILAPQQAQHATIVSSTAGGQNIVIPVSSSNVVRGSLAPTQATMSSPSAGHKFIITPRDGHQQQIQVQHHAQSQGQIILTSSPTSTSLSASPISMSSQTPILVSSDGSVSSGILIQNTATTTISPRGQTFIHPGGNKQQIQINSQGKQVFMTQQGEARELLSGIQPGQTHTVVITPTLAQALNSNSPSSPSGILAQQKLASLVADSLNSSNIITIPNKVSSASTQGQQFQNVMRGTVIPPGGTQRHIIPSTEPVVADVLTERGQNQTPPPPPGYDSCVRAIFPGSSDGSMTPPEYTRPVTVVSPGGTNFVVQLAGVPPGTKLTPAQIYQLRNSILQQSPKSFVNVVTSSPPQVRPETQSQIPGSPGQMKRIQLVPSTQGGLGPSASPTTTEIISGLTTPTLSPEAHPPLSTSSPQQLVPINTAGGIRYIRQSLIDRTAKEVAERAGERIDFQELIKRAESRTNVTTGQFSHFSEIEVGTITSTDAVTGDLSATEIAIPGVQTPPYSQGQILLPARSAAVTTVPSGTLCMTRGGLPQQAQQPQPVLVIPGKGVPTSSQQVSLVRGPVAPGTISSGVMSSPFKFSPTLRQQTFGPTRVLEYQSGGTYGPLTLLRTNSPPQPHIAVSPRPTTRMTRSPAVPGGITYRKSPTNETTVQLSPRPLTNPNVRTQLFTPVSQISLVRGTVPISSSSTTVTTIPVTYSATKTSLLRQPVPVTTTTESQRTQLFQRPQIISGPLPPSATTLNSSMGPTIVLSNVGRATTDPPKLIVNSSTSSTTNVYTIYTTTTTATTAGTATTSTTASETQE